MSDTIKAFWREASAVKRALLVGVPIVVIALVAVGVGFAMSGGGGEASNQQVTAPTEAPTDTPEPSSTAALTSTETPASAGLQNSTPPPGVGGGGSGAPSRAPVQAGSGPGAPTGTGMSLVIPSIGVNAPVYGRSVGTNGQMGNPSGPWDVVWYDFSQNWNGLGGFPGEQGANAVFAGHVDYIRVGPAVFWSLRDLGPGAAMTVNTNNGPVNYVVDWSQWADPAADFTQYVGKTGADSITLVTCIGTFSGHEYSNRFIVRGHRV